jgi:ferric-dicitrate binding protein FerR (iron transport regulator)
METSRLTERAVKTAKDLKSMFREKSADLMKKSAELADRSPVVIERRRSRWQVGAMWFAAGMAIAAALGFFFDSQKGSARRHMAYDKAMATGRDVTDWSGKKARHLRNKAMGTMAELKGPSAEPEPRPASTREFGS